MVVIFESISLETFRHPLILQLARKAVTHETYIYFNVFEMSLVSVCRKFSVLMQMMVLSPISDVLTGEVIVTTMRYLNTS